MRHGLQSAGSTLLRLVGQYIGWDCLSCNGLWAHVNCGNFVPFCRGHWLAQLQWQTKRVSRAVQGDCEGVYFVSTQSAKLNRCCIILACCLDKQGFSLCRLRTMVHIGRLPHWDHKVIGSRFPIYIYTWKRQGGSEWISLTAFLEQRTVRSI